VGDGFLRSKGYPSAARCPGPNHSQDLWFGVGRTKVQEAPIEIQQSGDTVEAKLADGKQAYLKLRREPGIDGKGVVLKNVKYFEAVQNDGFQMYNRSSTAPMWGDMSFLIRTATRS